MRITNSELRNKAAECSETCSAKRTQTWRKRKAETRKSRKVKTSKVQIKKRGGGNADCRMRIEQSEPGAPATGQGSELAVVNRQCPESAVRQWFSGDPKGSAGKLWIAELGMWNGQRRMVKPNIRALKAARPLTNHGSRVTNHAKAQWPNEPKWSINRRPVR